MGRAKTVLVFDWQGNAKALISAVVAKASVPGPYAEAVSFHGPAVFTEKTALHLREVVYPAAEAILSQVGIALQAYQLSVVNLSAASAMDVGLTITGFSADVPVFLALVSAALRAEISEGVVATGHIASPDGDIRMVKSLPAKLAAAVADQTIDSFLYPSLNDDASLQAVSPTELERVRVALAQASGRLKLVEMGDVAQLLMATLPEEQVVLASLKLGFFGNPDLALPMATPSQRAVAFLSANLDSRFWRVMEQSLLREQGQTASHILKIYVAYHLRRKKYPVRFGERLLRLLMSLPHRTRQMRLSYPLLPLATCVRLSRFVGEGDLKDVALLFKAVSGDITVAPQAAPASPLAAHEAPVGDEPQADLLSGILAQMSPEALLQVSLPLDTARACYPLDSTVVQSAEQFHEVVAGFWAHLMRHAWGEVGSLDPSRIAAEALNLLEAAFARTGGSKEALIEALEAPRGGLRHVLDQMTEQFKRQEQAKHINRVLKQALDPRDWEGRVALMAALLQRLGPNLPPEVRDRPPEMFAQEYEVVIQAYVASMDQLRNVFRNY